MDVIEIRKHFPEIEYWKNYKSKNIVYLDSAATSLMPIEVAETLKDFYIKKKANVHRGAHIISQEATNAFEDARKAIADFINAKPLEIAFVKNTTEALNVIAHGLRLKGCKKVLLTVMEHHSNIVPWQMYGYKIRFLKLTPNNELDLSDVDELLSDVDVISVTHVSNVLGVINPVRKLFLKAKEHNVITVVDAAQSAPHMPIDVNELKADMLAFSGHKMLGPSVGVFYCNKDINIEPLLGGGSMISEVSMHKSSWTEKPFVFEAGTPPIAEAVAISRAIEFLKTVGLNNISKHDKQLCKQTIECLSEINGLRLLTPRRNYSSIVSFDIGVHPHDVAEFLNAKGLCLRAGHHCAMPLHNYLGLIGSVRASFYLYNTEQEIEKLCAAIKDSVRFFKNKLGSR